MYISSPRIDTRQKSSSATVPPPVGGLNGRDPLADMDRKDAYAMDNVIPGTATVKSRKGCTKFTASSVGAPVLSLDVYTGSTGDKMLAWAADKIYDVSTGVPSVKKSGLATGVAVTTMFSNSADNAQWMIMVNGQNTPMGYDGTSITDLVITGMTVSTSQLNYVKAFKGRLYFAHRDKLGFFYLGVGAIQGAASYFDLAQVSAKGGRLVAIASYTQGDSGDTPQDYIVFVTSKGECIVYGGHDPSDANNWELVGRYYTAEPIGGRCIIPYGTDTLILTLDGAIPFSEIRKAGAKDAGATIGADYRAITSKLGNYLSSLNTYADVAGWQGLQYQSDEGWLIINAPASPSIAGAYSQFVMNTQTNAWCRFTNWNGICFCVYNKRLYFGRYDGWIMLGDEGRNDDEGASITFNVKTAYNYFEDGSGLGMLQKHFQWANLMLSCDGEPGIDGKFNVDFTEEMPEYITTLADDGSAEWDTADWDTSTWAGEAQTQRAIITLNKAGFCGALWLRASLDGLTFQWYSTQYVMEKTRGLLI